MRPALPRSPNFKCINSSILYLIYSTNENIQCQLVCVSCENLLLRYCYILWSWCFLHEKKKKLFFIYTKLLDLLVIFQQKKKKMILCLEFKCTHFWLRLEFGDDLNCGENYTRLRLFLEKEMATLSHILAWRIPMDRGAWWAAVHRIAKNQTWLKWLSTCKAILELLPPFSNCIIFWTLFDILILIFPVCKTE